LAESSWSLSIAASLVRLVAREFDPAAKVESLFKKRERPACNC